MIYVLFKSVEDICNFKGIRKKLCIGLYDKN